jgi:hypothetical protein
MFTCDNNQDNLIMQSVYYYLLEKYLTISIFKDFV